MADYTASSSSTSSTFINLLFINRDRSNQILTEDELNDLDSSSYVKWNSMEHPDWVVSMTHHMNATGNANDLSLALFHHIDTYQGIRSNHVDTVFAKNLKIENKTSMDTDQPGFLLDLINSSYNTIYFQYGYAHSSNVSLTKMTDTKSKHEKRTDNSWFRMYITEVNNSYDTQGITIDITAVSTLVNSESIFGSSVSASDYDWIADPERRIPNISPKVSYVIRLKEIIKVFGKGRFNIDFGKLNTVIPAKCMNNYMQYESAENSGDTDNTNTEDTETDGLSNNNAFIQTAGQGNYEFIISLLDNLIAYDAAKSYQTYTEDGVEKHTWGYPWYQGWTMYVEDTIDSGTNSLPTLHITYTTVMYTRGNLNDVFLGKVNKNLVTESDILNYNRNYKPFLMKTNDEGGNNVISSLFYNYGAFNRDIFQSQRVSSEDITRYSSQYFKSIIGQDTETSLDIIDLSLSSQLIAGVAGMIQDGGVSYITNSGQQMSADPISIINSSGNYESVEIARYMNYAKNFNKVLNQLFAAGSVTVPGTGQITTIMSLVNIYIYVSNRLDNLSGKYRILDQEDSIVGGYFTTTYNVQKVLTFGNDKVYNSAAAQETLSQNLSFLNESMETNVTTDSNIDTPPSSAEILVYEKDAQGTWIPSNHTITVSLIHSSTGLTTLNSVSLDSVWSINKNKETPLRIDFLFTPKDGVKYVNNGHFYYNVFDEDTNKPIRSGNYNFGIQAQFQNFRGTSVGSNIPGSSVITTDANGNLRAQIYFGAENDYQSHTYRVRIIFDREDTQGREQSRQTLQLGVQFYVKVSGTIVGGDGQR